VHRFEGWVGKVRKAVGRTGVLVKKNLSHKKNGAGSQKRSSGGFLKGFGRGTWTQNVRMNRARAFVGQKTNPKKAIEPHIQSQQGKPVVIG